MTHNPSFDPKTPVYLAKCEEYDTDEILRILNGIGEEMALDENSFKGKKVVIKPNLVAKKSSDDPTIVHPAVVKAVIRWLKGLGADELLIAESPGGVYNNARLKGIYSASGIDSYAEKLGAILNYDTGSSEVSNSNGKLCRLFDIIDPIISADVIVDLCKLKTHALTGMSAAVKNLFGTIPGIVKFEMHSRYPDYDDFANVLVDLCEMHCRNKEVFAITDAVIGMEGNGPTAGTPRHIGALLVSRNPFASDAVSSDLISCDGKIATVRHSSERCYTYKNAAECEVRCIGGASLDALRVTDYKQPDSADKNTIEILRNLWGGRIYKLFMPYPTIDYTACLGCGECAASCPNHTIEMRPANEVKGAKRSRAKRVPVIIRDNCIRCFCCQELCPHKVVKIKKNPITRILS